MGLLRDLIADRANKKQLEEKAELDAYMKVLGDPSADPGYRQIAYDKLTKAAGVTGQNRGVMDRMFAPFLQKGGGQQQQAQGGNPQQQQLQQLLQRFQGGGAPGMSTGGSQPPANASPAPWAQRPTNQNPAQAYAQQPMFQRQRTPQEEDQAAAALNQAKENQTFARETAVEDYKFNLQNKQYALGRQDIDTSYQQTVAQINAGPGTPDQKLERISAAQQYARQKRDQLFDSQYGIKTPTTPAYETKVTELQLADGTVVPAREVAPGQFTRLNGEAIDPNKITGVGAPKTGPAALTGEDKDYAWAIRTQQDPKASKEDKQIADGIVKKWKQGEQGRALNIEVKQQGMAGATQSGQPSYAYKPGGPSVANPKGDTAMDMWAAHYLTTGSYPPLGLGSQMATQERRTKIAQRAAEMAADLGFSPLEAQSLQPIFKANAAAIGRVTTQGAQVQQFENTVERNMQTAQALSKQFSRSNLPFANRIAAAWKTGTGDPEAVNFSAQMHALANEWAKVMQGSTSAAGATVSSAKDAEAIMSPYLSKGQVDSLFKNVILPDMQNRSAAIEDEKQTLAQQLRNAGGSSTGGATAPANLPKPARNGDRLSKTDAQKFLDAAGGDKDKARQMARDAGWTM